MNVYFDTGPFLDYLSRRGHVGPFLRHSERRGRSVELLAEDAEHCFGKAQAHHKSVTSSITLYEVENALYLALSKESAGLSNRHQYLITSARSVTIQVLSVVEFHSIDVLPLTQAVFERAVTELELQRRGIKAADSLHVASALASDADLIITADDDILKLDKAFTNSRGEPIQCMDSDVGKNLL
jgi:hypothetical protein